MFQALAFQGGEVRPRVSWLRGNTTAGLPSRGFGAAFFVALVAVGVVVALGVVVVIGVAAASSAGGGRLRTAAYVGLLPKRAQDASSVVDTHACMHVWLDGDVETEHDSISGSVVARDEYMSGPEEFFDDVLK